MSEAKTVLFYLCPGCDTPLGLQLLPWAGVNFESTHTLCDGCRDQVRTVLDRGLQDRAPVDIRPAA